MLKKILPVICVLLVIFISSCKTQNSSYEKIKTVKLGDDYISSIYYLAGEKSEEDIKADSEKIIKEIYNVKLRYTCVIILFDRKWAKKIANKKAMISLSMSADFEKDLLENSSCETSGGEY